MNSNINSRICTPVTGSTLVEFLSNLKIIQQKSEFVELRLDYINDLKIQDIATIKQATKVKNIATCRSKSEGGHWQKSEQERLEILQFVLKQDFDYVDIELATVRANSKPIKRPGDKKPKKANQKPETEQPKLDLNKKAEKTKLILSFHDFEGTPNYRNLRKIQKIMRSYNCDVQKFACMVKNNLDTINLTRLLTSKNLSESMCVVGMGNLGKFIRVNSLLLGAEFSFASLQDRVTAPGQISIDEMKRILNIF